MAPEARTNLARPLAVWLLVTGVVAAAWAIADASLIALASARVWQGAFEDLLVAVAGAALVVSASWLWVVTTATVADVVGGRPFVDVGTTRRLVLVACGVAVAAGVSGPAIAGGGSEEPTLGGLPFPDRAVASAPAAPAPQPTRVAVPTPILRPAPPASTSNREAVTVRPGDSLWSIAAADLGPGAGPREIDDRWRVLYAANRSAIGTDPDLIIPGQQLRLDTDR